MNHSQAEISAMASAHLKALDALLEPCDRTDSPGAIVAVALHGRVIYRKAVGMASLEHGVANTPATRVRISSTSKHFTAMGILLLVEDGLVRLDDPLQKHLPEFPMLSDKGPTIAHLLTHTGGWRSYDELWSMSNGLVFHEPGTGMPAMQRQSALNFEPGTRMAYSNGGYHMLAKIIERVSGMGYNEFLTRRLFVPLDMPDTQSVPTDHDVVRGLADRYIPKVGGGWRHGVYPCELEGGGSLVSTVDDMLRWLAHLRGDRKIVGRPGTWASLHAPTTLDSGAQVAYGFGLSRHPYRGVDIIHHSGAVLGATSQMLTVPSHGLDIVILVNGAPLHPGALALKIVDLVLGDALPERHEVRPSASAFPAIVGRNYAAQEEGGLIRFGEAEEKITLSWQSAPGVPMHHAGDRVWVGVQEIAISDMEFSASAVQKAQAPHVLEVKEAGVAVSYELLPETPPTAAELAPRLVGSYHGADLDATAEITLADGRLQAAVRGRYGSVEGTLEILSDRVLSLVSSDALLSRLGRVTVFVDCDDATGAATGLRLSTARSRNVCMHRIGERK
ncbi:beta-lactamase family protein [Diaphorobacter ruginosibacter]|uniref:Beta-lactamase family protein n=1 Tax=Diaphorobacter ruginosibacter TaxID=1715720 RepID=A0A7G9RPL8_9BURK|nr:serine hydrolase domain-containing protein [Diaphorobacter ruginosibacter]QNN57543.1 beta-lactamase family protein [Diaphorobacter ruginosibacter]